MEKVKSLTQKYRNLMEELKPMLWEIASLVGSLCSTAQTVMLEFFKKVISLPLNSLSESKFNLRTSMVSKNPKNNNWKSILPPINKAIIQIDASQKCCWDAIKKYQ